MQEITVPPARAGAGTRPRVAATLILASIGAFVTSLDIVVVSTALPSLRVHLGANLSDLEWTINAYNLAFASLILTGAALGDRFGRRRLYVIGLAVFTASSLACAMAGSASVLIAARAAEGVGAAIVLPVSLTLISEAFPLEKRGTAIGIWGGITGLGVATAPLLGGAIIQGLDWQWIFWINIPIGLVSAVASAVMLTESRGPRPRLDLVGLPLIALGLLALVWAPVRAPVVGWSSGQVVGALTAGAILIGAFVFWEGRAPMPMVPIEYFRRRGFAAVFSANGSYGSHAAFLHGVRVALVVAAAVALAAMIPALAGPSRAQVLGGAAEAEAGVGSAGPQPEHARAELPR